MNKIFIIIKREYLDRIRKKTFLLSTILFPVLYMALIFGSGYLAEKTRSDLKVAVIDSSGLFDKGRLARANTDSSVRFTAVNSTEAVLREQYDSLGFDGYVVIPGSIRWDSASRYTLLFQSEKKFGIPAIQKAQEKMNAIWTEIKTERMGLDEQEKKIIEKGRLTLTSADTNKADANTGTATVIGYVSGFLIYLILLIYGSQVMMGVMEEKTNRIAEVMVSSVKPFQLMLGKIVGIGLVALTQFVIWIASVFLIYNFTKSAGSGLGTAIGSIQQVFSSINIPLVIFCFIFYFIGGFMFYASLYAAIGSAVNEDMREAQSLSFPVTMLVIFSIFMMSPAISDPSGPIAFWGSMIPFSSPIVMLCRIPFGVPGTVPWWQLGLSMFLLVAGFLFTVWLSGKIYRTGILMYGKKPSWKELLKWAFRK